MGLRFHPKIGSNNVRGFVQTEIIPSFDSRGFPRNPRSKFLVLFAVCRPDLNDGVVDAFRVNPKIPKLALVHFKRDLLRSLNGFGLPVYFDADLVSDRFSFFKSSDNVLDEIIAGEFGREFFLCDLTSFDASSKWCECDGHLLFDFVSKFPNRYFRAKAL